MWQIPRVIVNRMFGHAQRMLPNECVGVLSGTGHTITGWHPLTNADADPSRFLADPQEQITLFKQLRDAGQQVVALYHSHPDGDAEPSEKDLAEAYYPEALYLIVAMGTEGCLDLSAHLIQDGKAIAQKVAITEA
ncbi:MAG: M67 family metallopeptidase [Magnetococcales bacterium]|nr:M67 family metallopeptidase [Magnetococcales bacterium]